MKSYPIMNKIDAQEELQRILSEEISKSIDAQILNDLKPYIRESKIDTILKNLEDTNVSEL